MADNMDKITDEQLSKVEQWRDVLGDAYENTINIHEQLLKNVKALQKTKDETVNVYDLEDKLNKLLKERNELSDKEAAAAREANNVSADYAKVIKDGFDARRKQGEELGKITRITEQLNALNEYEKQHGSLTAAQQADKAKLLADETKVRNKLAEHAREEKKLNDFINKGHVAGLQTLNEEEKAQLRKYLYALRENEQFEEYVKNHYGSLEAFEKSINAQKEQLSNWELITQKVENVSKKLDKFKEMGGVKETLGFINKQLAAVGISFGDLLKNVLAFDHALTESAKNLGISVQGARALADQFEGSAMRASDINKNATPLTATIKNQFQAQQEINDALGTSLLLTEKQRIDQVVITQQMGLQASEGAELYKLGKLNQTSAEAVTKTVADQVINARKTLGVQLDYRTVLKDVAKVSGQLSAQYQNNPELIAKAVTQAKALGLEMQQTAAMSDKLLSFESSIENELKAELLTGKQLNLEKARELALRGDTAAAAKELMNNVGGLSEFQNLNVIQQRSLADAIGLSADELANSLKSQEMLKNSAFETEAAFKAAAEQAVKEGKSQEFINSLRQAGNSEEMIAQASQISAQTKFQLAVEKLKESLANLVMGPFGKMIDGFSKLVSNAGALKGLLTAITVIMAGSMLKGIASFTMQMLAARTAATGTAAASIATASAITMGIGIVAVIAGIASAVSALNSATGENISVSSATGGGGSTNVDQPKPYKSRNEQNSDSKPMVVNLNLNNNTVQTWEDNKNQTLASGKHA